MHVWVFGLNWCSKLLNYLGDNISLKTKAVNCSARRQGTMNRNRNKSLAVEHLYGNANIGLSIANLLL